MASEEKKEEAETPPPAYVEPVVTAVAVIDKERPDSAWDEPAPARDPQRLNTHLQIEWDDLIGEPDGVKTMDCSWDLSKKCYSVCIVSTNNFSSFFSKIHLMTYFRVVWVFVIPLPLCATLQYWAAILV